MEDIYWWHPKNMAKLEEGQFLVSNKELEEKIGSIIFSVPDFANSWNKRLGWKLTSKNNNVKVQLYQTPWNCGQYVMCGIGMGKEVIEVQDFMAMNMCHANTIKVMTCSANPIVIPHLQSLGWIHTGTFPGRFNDKEAYFIKETGAPGKAYNGAGGVFVPKESKPKKDSLA